MKLKNVLITVDDIEEAKKFYHDLFGLDVLLDSDDNVILMEGLVLQERKMWGNFLQQEIIPENNACELYFEERDIEAFAQKLKELYPSIHYLNLLTTYSWGQKVLRFYDPSGNLIEVGTPNFSGEFFGCLPEYFYRNIDCQENRIDSSEYSC